MDALGQKVFHTTKGFAVEIDGEVLGLCGVMYSQPFQCFSAITPEMKNYPIMLMKTAKKLAGLLNEFTAPVYATADPDHPTSAEFLERVGFTSIDEGIYKWPLQSQ